MDWLLHNPVADLYGPYFLVLYGGVILVTIAVCGAAVSSRDTSDAFLPPDTPHDTDPYAIAFLRGGENEVVRLAVFDLVQRGFLQVAPHRGSSPEGPWALEANAPDGVAPLSELEARIVDYFHRTHTAKELFQSGIPYRAKQACAACEEWLQKERLLNPEETAIFGHVATFVGGLAILGLGLYKLGVALSKGHSDVLLLILMGIGGIAALSWVCTPSRMSRRGKLYLRGFQRAFRDRTKVAGGVHRYDPLVVLFGIFGVDALAGTSYAYFKKFFTQQATGRSSGGCGGGCSGCGDGCGGCGGCGG